MDSKITAADPNDSNYQNEELKLFELRNSMVVRAENYYENACFNLAIKICQELTDELRVIKWKISNILKTIVLSKVLIVKCNFFLINYVRHALGIL